MKNMVKNKFGILVAPFLIMLLCMSCAKQQGFDDQNVMQIKNVGLRQGVFIRRYKLTGEYGRNNVFTSNDLQAFIEKVMEPDYLLIQNAYDLGLNKDKIIQQKLLDYKVNLLADNNPIRFAEMTISKEDLHEFYEKKSFRYDIDFIQTNSYYSADSIYKFLSGGHEIPAPKYERPGFGFSQFIELKNVTYGERIHPELWPGLLEMKEGEISAPVYTSPTWTILKLEKKREDKDIPSYEKMEKELLIQAEALLKYQRQKRFIQELRQKYPVTVMKDYYEPLIDAHRIVENHGWIDKNKLDESMLKAPFIQINNDKIPLSHFISSFNQANQFLQVYRLTEQDIDHFVDDVVTQFLLYLDSLEKNVDKDILIKDKLENKEHRMLLTEYLKKEIAPKTVISDEDARKYYENNRSKWRAEYEKVAPRVKNDLKNKRMVEKRQKVIDKLQKKYHVRYNEAILKQIAEQLNSEKALAKSSGNSDKGKSTPM
jgi:uncharacterized protein YlxP (DUF503 family)